MGKVSFWFLGGGALCGRIGASPAFATLFSEGGILMWKGARSLLAYQLVFLHFSPRRAPLRHAIHWSR
jgi:hypothetical protein